MEEKKKREIMVRRRGEMESWDVECEWRGRGGVKE